MSTSEKILSITDILNVIQSNPSHYYNSSRTRFRVEECDALLQQIVPYIDKVLSENPNQFIYILVAWVYKILSIPYTEIDGIEFYLLKIENDENGRDKLQILSVDTHSQSPHIFYVYTSKSSGSMWRYCEYDDQYRHFNKGYDYISNTVPQTFPDGFDIEIFKSECILKALKFHLTKYDLEHVTPFIK